jgi:class 3 adenylate cyclase/tetratricopeptide (TPR) repeat protein
MPPYEHKIISAIFADVVEYTAITEKLGSESVQQIMNGCFTILSEQVRKYGGIEKLLGDGLLAFFGAPAACEDHAQRACYAALAMQELLSPYAIRMKSIYNIDFRMRIGISSGEVIAGRMGSELNSEYTAVGQTVNLASRMQKLAAPGTILVSADTYALIRDFFHLEEYGRLSIDGLEQPVMTHSLLGVKQVEQRFDVAVARGLGRFIGRQEEMSILNQILNQVKKGTGLTMGIRGEPGIGKSRLLLEFVKSLPPSEYTCLEARCLDYSQNIPYRPLFDILRQFFGLKEEDTETGSKEKIKAKLRRMENGLISYLPFIHGALSLQVEDESYAKMENQYRRMKLIEAVTRLLILESQKQPMVIAIEDLHWLDRTSEDVLNLLIDRLAKAPILFLISYRPEYTPPWSARLDFRLLTLSPLSSESSQALLLSLLPDGKADLELRQSILTKAGGNPLFLEEYIHTLTDNRNIGQTTEVKLPETIQGIIASRIDRLPPDLKNTLQVASVIGREFAFPVLQGAGADGDLRFQIGKLRALEFITEKTTLSLEWVFKHALVQEVAYHSLSGSRRSELHRKVGETLESLYSRKGDEQAEVLAYHFQRGQAREKAFFYMKKAGKKSLDRYALQESHLYYQAAYDILTGLPDMTGAEKTLLIDLIIEWAYVFYFRADIKGVMALLNTHLDLAVSISDTRRKAWYWGWQGYFLVCMARPLDAYSILCRALEVAEDSGDQTAVCFICASLVRACNTVGLYEDSLVYGQRSRDIVEKSEPDGLLVVFTFDALGDMWSVIGHQKKAMECSNTLVGFGEKRGNVRAIISGYVLSALFYSECRDIANTLDIYRRAWQLSPDPLAQALLWHTRGMVYTLAGRSSEIEPELKEEVQACRDNGNEEFRLSLSLFWGIALVQKGRMSQGLRIMLEAQKDYLRLGKIPYYGFTDMFLGTMYSQMVYQKVCVKTGLVIKNSVFIITQFPFAYRKALFHYQRAAQVLENIGSLIGLSYTFLELGRLFAHKGRKKTAREYLRKSICISREIEANIYLRDAEDILKSLENKE